MVCSRFFDDPGLAPILGDVCRFSESFRVLDLPRRIGQQNDSKPGIEQLNMFGSFQRNLIGPGLRAQLLGSYLQWKIRPA
jgi:hypothetical protein